MLSYKKKNDGQLLQVPGSLVGQLTLFQSINNLQAKAKARQGFLSRTKALFTQSVQYILVKSLIPFKCALNGLDVLHHSAILVHFSPPTIVICIS